MTATGSRSGGAADDPGAGKPPAPRAADRSSTGRTGRRPGESGTRSAIERAALNQFAARGFAGATLRAIAAEAGVDPALISHYFGGKQELFQAVLSPPEEVLSLVTEIGSGPPESVAEQLAGMIVRILADPDLCGRLEALLRTAASDPQAATLLRERVTDRLVGPIAQALSTPDAELRANMVGVTLAGLVLARQVLLVEPIASAAPDRIGDLLAAGIRAYLAP